MNEPGVRVKVSEREPGSRVALVTIDNRARLNSLSSPLLIALRAAFDEVGKDESIRVAVLTGAGERAFVGGADLNELRGLDADTARLFITRLHEACLAIRECPVPVIARVNGFCLGGGLELPLGCHFRLAAADGASIGLPELDLGSVPAWGGSARLTRWLRKS